MAKRLSLKDSHPAIAKQAHGWDPGEVSSGSQKKLRWRCHKGHIWEAVVKNRTLQNQGCPFCSGKRLIPGVNDLASAFPDIASEADGWSPKEVHKQSNKVLPWICAKEHHWTDSVSNRSGKGYRCPYCTGKRVLAGFNDLRTLNPYLAAEAFGWNPSEFTVNSNKIVEWKCKKEHTWKVSINNRSSHKTGCPTCSGQKILPGFNDLATINPKLAKEALDWDTKTVGEWSHKRVSWVCQLGHTYEARVADRSNGDGCPVCAGKIVLPGFNDLATINPKLSEQALGWDPKTLTPFSNKIVMWRCEEGHTWKASVNHRSNERGCPTCAKSGFDPNKDGFIYFLLHPIWEMYQIGITNFPDKRLATHGRSGWTVIELRGPMEGHLAQDWETAILRMLRKAGANLGEIELHGSFDGFTEAWSIDTYRAENILQLMRVTETFEERKSKT
jgi:hypothetical protein